MKPTGQSATALFERLLKKAPPRPDYVLVLFVAGLTPRSTQAVHAIKTLCEECLAGRYELRVVDLYLHPRQAKQAQILAAPTLLKLEPGPARRLIGNLTDRRRVLQGLGLSEEITN